MRCRDLVIVCGAAMAMSAPGALAQSQQDQERQTRERQTELRQNQYGQQSDVQSVLRQLEGTWRVNIELNPQLLSKSKAFGGFDASRIMGTDSGLSDPQSDRQSRDQQREEQERQDREREDRERQDQDRTNRDQQGQDPDRRDLNTWNTGGDQQQIEGAKTLQGYAHTQLILDGHVLRENFVIMGGEGMTGSDPTTPNRTGQSEAGQDPNQNRADLDRTDQPGQDRTSDPTRPQGEAGKDVKMQGLAFISFDNQSNQYNVVMMNSHSGRMHYDTGRYDASSKQIVFDGRSGHQMPAVDESDRIGHDRTSQDRTGEDRTGQDRTGQDRTGQDRTGQDSTDRDRTGQDRTGQPERDQWNRDQQERMAQYGYGSELENVRIVLEIKDNDTHTVTMYAMGGQPMSGDQSPTTGRDREAYDRESTTQRATDAMEGTIVYRATYTRLNGDSEETFDESFSDADRDQD